MIEKLNIQNFRCFEDITLDFTGMPSSLIIGKNGAGKSTIRKALSVLQQICRGSSRMGQIISPSDFWLHNTDRQMRFWICLKLDQKKYTYSIALDWPENFREARIQSEHLSVDGEVIFSREQVQVTLGKLTKFRLDWHVFALPVIDEKPPAKTIRVLTSYLSSLVVVSPIPSKMTGYSERPSSKLENDASNLSSCLRDLFESDYALITPFTNFIVGIIPDFSAIKNVDRGKDGKQYMVTFKKHDSNESLELEFDELSDGQKCFFLCGYFIAANAAGRQVMCMWDEPDNHLSISEIGQFIMSLRRMTNSGGQFIATSHHPEIIRHFSDENTIVLTRKSQVDPTVPQLLKDIEYHGDLINALIREEIIG